MVSGASLEVCMFIVGMTEVSNAFQRFACWQVELEWPQVPFQSFVCWQGLAY